MRALPTRQTLISKVMDQRDEEAWEDFVSYYGEYLENVLQKSGVTQDEAKDVVQNTLIKLWELLPSFDYNPEKGRFRSWVTRVTLNIMKEYFRNKSRSNRVVDEGFLEQKQVDDKNFADFLEDEWQVFIAKRAWENISREISPIMKETFELYMSGFKSSEIVEKLGIGESTVRVYKKRIRLKLKFELARLEQELS